MAEGSRCTHMGQPTQAHGVGTATAGPFMCPWCEVERLNRELYLLRNERDNLADNVHRLTVGACDSGQGEQSPTRRPAHETTPVQHAQTCQFNGQVFPEQPMTPPGPDHRWHFDGAGYKCWDCPATIVFPQNQPENRGDEPRGD